MQWIMWALLLVVMLMTIMMPLLYIRENRKSLERDEVFSKLLGAIEKNTSLLLETKDPPEGPFIDGKPTKVIIEAGQTGALDRLQLLHSAILEVKDSVEKLKDVVEDLPRNLNHLNAGANKEFGNVVIEFREALQMYLKEWPKISQTIVQDHQNFLNLFARQFNELQNQIEIWVQTANQQTAQLIQANQQLENTEDSTRARPRPKSLPSAKPTRTAPLKQLNSSPKSAQTEPASASPKPIQAEPVKQPIYSFNEDRQRFNEVREWVNLNIQRIMRKSAGEWSKPEELLLDNPPHLELTASILDQKVLLVGTERYSHKLALGLPNTYLADYYDWFSMPKGSNEQIKQTLDPAIVEETDDSFYLVHRGSLKQD